MSRTLFQKSVAEIMSDYAPVYPESRTWTDTVDYLLTHEEEIISELQRQYLKFGHFREPVILKLNDPDDEQTDLITGKIGYVADGTHRLVSAYLLGVETILVSDRHEDIDEINYSIVTKVSSVSKRIFDPDEMEIFFDKFRSICVSDHLWITSSTASGEPHGVSIYWDEYDSEFLQIINFVVLKKLSEIFPTHSFTVETVCESWDI